MEVYSGTSRTTLQPVVVSTSVSNFYTFINNTGFPKPKGKAVQINIMWRYNRTDYSQLSAEYYAREEEDKKMEEARRKAEEEKDKRERMEKEEGEERKRVEIARWRAEREKRRQQDRQEKDSSKDKSVAKGTVAIDDANPGVDNPGDDDETESEEETLWGEPQLLVRIPSLLFSTSLLESLAYWFIYIGPQYS